MLVFQAAACLTGSLWDVSRVHRAPQQRWSRLWSRPVSGSRGVLLKTAHLTALGPLAAFILGHLLRSYEGQRMKTSECPFNSDPALRGFDREAACGMRRFCAREFPVRLDHGGYWSVLTSPDPLVCPPFGPAELQSERGRSRRRPGVVGTVRRLPERWSRGGSGGSLPLFGSTDFQGILTAS